MRGTSKEAALWSLSIPDGGHSYKVVTDEDTNDIVYSIASNFLGQKEKVISLVVRMAKTLEEWFALWLMYGRILFVE